MRRGEIYLASFPFGDAPGMKIRPVLLLNSATGLRAEIVAAYISSVIPLVLLPIDIMLDPRTPECAASSLKVVSVLRLHKIGTIHSRSVKRCLGAFNAATMQEVDAKLRNVLSL